MTDRIDGASGVRRDVFFGLGDHIAKLVVADHDVRSKTVQMGIEVSAVTQSAPLMVTL